MTCIKSTNHSLVNYLLYTSSLNVNNECKRPNSYFNQEQQRCSCKALGLRSKKSGVWFPVSPISEICHLLPGWDMAEISLKRRKSSKQPILTIYMYRATNYVWPLIFNFLLFFTETFHFCMPMNSSKFFSNRFQDFEKHSKMWWNMVHLAKYGFFALYTYMKVQNLCYNFRPDLNITSSITKGGDRKKMQTFDRLRKGAVLEGARTKLWNKGIYWRKTYTRECSNICKAKRCIL